MSGVSRLPIQSAGAIKEGSRLVCKSGRNSQPEACHHSLYSDLDRAHSAALYISFAIVPHLPRSRTLKVHNLRVKLALTMAKADALRLDSHMPLDHEYGPTHENELQVCRY